MENIYKELIEDLEHLVCIGKGGDSVFWLNERGFFKKLYLGREMIAERDDHCFRLDKDLIKDDLSLRFDNRFTEQEYASTDTAKILKFLSEDKLLELVKNEGELYFDVGWKGEISMITENEYLKILIECEDDKLEIYTAYTLLDYLKSFDDDEKLALNKYDEALLDSFEF